MRKHRRTKGRVASKAQPDNFNPASALESLHAAILRAEALARVASDAVDHLRCPSSPQARRAFARMQILVAKAADEVSAALAHGDELMAALTRHMDARRDP
jgi:hypothetical protein